MSTGKTASASTLFQELFQFAIYKRSQGRIARQVTAGALMIAFAVASWRLHETLIGNETWTFFGSTIALPAVLLLGGCWFGFRIVNYPRFADFLIAVEAEMNKVSWPSKSELYRSSFVVIFVLLLMAFILFTLDIVWHSIFHFIGVVQ